VSYNAACASSPEVYQGAVFIQNPDAQALLLQDGWASSSLPPKKTGLSWLGLGALN